MAGLKQFVCRCEDVTLHELMDGIERGHRDIESLKRYTGFGTGPCQGKECVWAVARILHERTGAPVHAFTSRPPLVPTAFKYFARVTEEEKE